MDLKIFSTKEEVAKAFAEYFCDLVKDESDFNVALSGGSTPKIVFQELALNFGDKIAWDNLHFYWGDERCVPPTDDESNYLMTREYLLNRISMPKENIHRIKGENEPASEAVAYSDIIDKNLPKENHTPQFDLVILGMGDDGHTASIFPHQIELWDSPQYCEVATHPDSGQKRVSITGKIINNAKVVAFLVTGSAKADKVKEILNKEGGYQSYPASLVRPSSGELIWFIDLDAADQLSKSISG